MALANFADPITKIEQSPILVVNKDGFAVTETDTKKFMRAHAKQVHKYFKDKMFLFPPKKKKNSLFKPP